MKRITVVYVFLVMVVAMSMVLPGAAAAVSGEYDVYLMAESFEWKEFDDDGSELLEESGPLYGAGGSAKWNLHSLTMKVGGEIFGGTIDYDGQTFAGVPVETDAKYWGYRIEGLAGYEFIIADNASLEPFIGPAIKYWERDLEDTAISFGYRERWTNVYAKLGMLGTIGMSNEANIYAEGGVKIPIYNENRVGLFGITLEPGLEESYFAEIGVKIRLFKAAVFYEGLRFTRSDPEGGFLQPESEGDIFGVKVGASF